MNCRHCGEALHETFLDLGFAPPSNAYLKLEDLTKPEMYFPLKLKVCTSCWLVQTEDYTAADSLFTDEYAYFSSTSSTWLNHAREYCLRMTKELDLTQDSLVIEVASNDGYLLKNFVENKIPCMGIEPTASTAEVAVKLGIPVLRRFFGADLARELAESGKSADLIAGNNVYAHVPEINDFTKGLALALKPEGTITLEFPHLMKLIQYQQFDTVYHEHFSYLSLTAVSMIFKAAGLRIYHVEELSTHGGSLRVFGCHQTSKIQERASVQAMLVTEKDFGLVSVETYRDFQKQANMVKDKLLEFLLQAKKDGRTVAAYGAAAKGNTLLNYAGIKPDLLPFVSDAANAKQGKYLPGSHIPVLHPDKVRQSKPDVVIILPWNIADEVSSQLSFIREWGGTFARFIPEVKVW